jgi:hypothetical protein
MILTAFGPVDTRILTVLRSRSIVMAVATGGRIALRRSGHLTLTGSFLFTGATVFDTADTEDDPVIDQHDNDCRKQGDDKSTAVTGNFLCAFAV